MRRHFFYSASLTLLWLSASASAAVRITAINGTEYQDGNRPDTVQVKPGDVVTLSADVVGRESKVEDFIWSADDRADDVCNPTEDDDCLGRTNFEVNDYGVSFYVPYEVGARVTINTRHRETGENDSIILENGSSSEMGNPPTDVVSDLDDYKYQNFSPEYALAGHGRWVVINGARWWKPYADDAEWVPYQNGYWTRDEKNQLTWVSYDAWGWYTDHYGYWRHHGVYGWIWRGFEDGAYRPYVATFYYGETSSEYVGWYPYYEGYSAGYRDGLDRGFDDGYWDMRTYGRYYRSASFYPGLTLIPHRYFLSQNIYGVRIRDRAIILGFWGTSHSRGYYSHYLGGTTYVHSSIWFESRWGYRFPHSTLRVRSFGRVSLYCPTRIYSVPDSYRYAYGARSLRHRPYPVGAVVRYARGSSVTVVYPTRNRRGLSTPPGFRRSPLRTNRPALRNPENPVYRSPWNRQRRDGDNGRGGNGGGWNNGGRRNGGNNNGGGNGGGWNNGGRRGGNPGGGNNGGGNGGRRWNPAPAPSNPTTPQPPRVGNPGGGRNGGGWNNGGRRGGGNNNGGGNGGGRRVSPAPAPTNPAPQPPRMGNPGGGNGGGRRINPAPAPTNPTPQPPRMGNPGGGRSGGGWNNGGRRNGGGNSGGGIGGGNRPRPPSPAPAPTPRPAPSPTPGGGRHGPVIDPAPPRGNPGGGRQGGGWNGGGNRGGGRVAPAPSPSPSPAPMPPRSGGGRSGGGWSGGNSGGGQSGGGHRGGGNGGGQRGGGGGGNRGGGGGRGPR